jgi:hypothetical protein
VNRSALGLRFESDQPGINYGALEGDFEKEFSDIPFFGGKQTTESGADYAKAKVPAFLPSLRTAISIG